MKLIQGNHSSLRSVLIVALTLLAAGWGWWWAQRPPDSGSARPGLTATTEPLAGGAAPGSPAPILTAKGAATNSSFATLQAWLSEFRALTSAAPGDPCHDTLLREGIALAEQRRARMVRLIREHPDQALAEALRSDEYLALPEPIRRRVERPFSERATYSYLPICAGPDGRAPASGVDHLARLSLTDGTSAEAFTVGENGSIWQSGAVSPAGGWPAWQLGHFLFGSALCLPDRDPDGDGVPNLVEYALGRDPNSALGADGATALPKAVMTGGRLWLRLDLPEPAPGDMNYLVQCATNLPAGSWSTVAHKQGIGAWQWLGGGTPRLTTGAPADGRIEVDAGIPDVLLSQPGGYLRLILEAP